MAVMDRTNLSRLERGAAPYGQKVLEAAAKLYRCKPWDILERRIRCSRASPWISPTSATSATSNQVMPPRKQRAELLGYARGLVRRHRH